MTRILTLAAIAALALSAAPAAAHDHGIHIEDPYARASTPNAMSAAAFMVIVNETDTDDRLIAAASDAAQRVELHTHLMDAQGVMRMIEVEDGFAVPANGSHALERGGDHIMFMGLTEPFVHGETVTVTLTFEQSGEMVVEIPIDLERMDMGGHHGG